MVAPAALTMLYPTLFATLMQANYTIFPDGDGIPHLIKLDYTPLSAEQISNLATDVNSIKFILFTRSNPTNGQTVALNDKAGLQRTHWNSNKPTYILAHGWRSSASGELCTLVRDGFLKASDSNVICVDWNAIAKNTMYPQVAKSVPAVAEHVASFVNFLRSSTGLNTGTMKIVGHSLGAHIASLAARIVSRSSLVDEVVALDPAKPMFESNSADARVDRSHARNVQVIHTCAGTLGMDNAVGTSDFFVNGGSKQPGCNNDMLGSCSHGRSYEYFSESLTKPRGFAGVPKNGGTKAYMGGLTLDRNAKGSYDVKTASQPPYALGG